MTHVHEHDPSDFYSQEFWDERYSSTGAVWSGNPNQRLVEQTATLTPGRALDVGCGEGADVIWLASNGWDATGVDVSTVALERAAAQAAEAGAAIADHTTWQQVDIRSWEPPTGQFDLVSAQFMQLPEPARGELHRRLAAAVRPGGHLLIVGHHPTDMHASVGRPDVPDIMFTAEQVAAVLDPENWEILACAAPAREITDPDGNLVTIKDAVLHAVRSH
ncbi:MULTISPECIES: class I SAM-dependent methyltransferase [Rhodococcus]|uniref:Methyltransferase domain-containing protein n=1 Tax=Rhodococcus oxybenzonivorans TaxID=1990687 RepID=A0AAE4V2E1_9NOCA|nr:MULTISPECIES: methyltransferase domain-containing protein [Rhodococcus]MDV7242927.1 methyltransferase domain-containing protein [Rhodococcus oxybenzonivorans]MDV7266997.1 methyltransferase domain-containing protein [Rhodococcus oxybenzonivorans]MDV7275331.1 methyltransferase domain-containing protein [Rhodococcus oxybenzonivorans]MDV7334814.1 methyltransferase domain-containing protein [Rhodococcus oxybenzonivorans]MDV7344968.1 methyltransferase domain-containing protein [Rhodococcus oxyben